MNRNYISYKKIGSVNQVQLRLSNELKRQMNDIIDVAYKNEAPHIIRQYQRFAIFGTTKTLRSRHGDCLFDDDKSSIIRILNLAGRDPNDVLITTIHEVAHHIDFSIRGASGHDKDFYAVMKRLLCAALDMGILTLYDLVDEDRIEESHSSGRRKVGKMMADYVPQPIAYKQNISTLLVYNCYFIREHLKNREYRWNGLDKAWVKELQMSEIESEKKFLISLGVSEDDIKEQSSKGVSIRQRKIVCLYNVPFEFKDIPKELGYRWNTTEKRKYWEKRIFEDDISEQERIKLEQIPDVFIRIV